MPSTPTDGAVQSFQISLGFGLGLRPVSRARYLDRCLSPTIPTTGGQRRYDESVLFARPASPLRRWWQLLRVDDQAWSIRIDGICSSRLAWSGTRSRRERGRASLACWGPSNCVRHCPSGASQVPAANYTLSPAWAVQSRLQLAQVPHKGRHFYPCSGAVFVWLC